jgi:serine/threonine protein kinase
LSDQSLDELLNLWEAATERGESVDILSLAGNNKELASELERLIQLLHNSQWMVRSPTDLMLDKATDAEGVTVGSLDFAKMPMSQILTADGLRVGDVIQDRYRLIHVLGEGASSFVWMANDMKLERLVAIKVFKRSILDEQTISIFLNEARIMARFEHPAILPIYDQFLEDRRLFLVIKFVPKTAGENRRPDMKNAARIILQICESLKFLHENRVLHCDIKPSNILVDPAGHAYLSDYGVAAEQNTLSASHKAGTKGYLAPERVTGQKNTPQSDIFSLGMVFFYYLKGYLPEHPDQSKLKLELKDVPKKIVKIIVRATDTNPEARYASIDEFSRELQQVVKLKDLKTGQVIPYILISIIAILIGSYLTFFRTGSQKGYPINILQLPKVGNHKIISGDWNFDKMVDVAALNQETKEIHVFLNQGDGKFQNDAVFLNDNQITDINSSTFNREGDDYLVISSSNYSNLTIVSWSGVNLNQIGSQLRLNLIAPTEPNMIDLDDDGFNDLVCRDSESNDISIRIGRKNEKFASEQIFYTSEDYRDRTTSLHIEDLNGDRLKDIVVGIYTHDQKSGISIFLQQKGEKFEFYKRFLHPQPAKYAKGAWFDYDKDGDNDLIMPDSIGEKIDLLVNDGLGNFSFTPIGTINKPIELVPLIPQDYFNPTFFISTDDAIYKLSRFEKNPFSLIKLYELNFKPSSMIITDLDNNQTNEILVTAPKGQVINILKGEK